MESKIFDALNVDLSHFVTGIFKYEHKSISFDAVQVTKKNIGKLSLELETELFIEDGTYWFSFKAMRNREGIQSVIMEVEVGDWIFPLEDEIHVWDNQIFQDTFVPMGDLWVEPAVGTMGMIQEIDSGVVMKADLFEESIKRMTTDRPEIPHIETVKKQFVTPSGIKVTNELREVNVDMISAEPEANALPHTGVMSDEELARFDPEIDVPGGSDD